MKKNILYRMMDYQHKRVKDYCENNGLKIGYIVGKAIEEYLDRVSPETKLELSQKEVV